MRESLLAIALVLTAGCDSTGPSEVQLGQEFVLAPNQTAQIEGTGWSVGFRRVVEDSRCAVDMACVWSGNGAVELDLFDTAPDSLVVLNTSAAAGPTSWTDGTYELRLVDLTPYPRDEQKIEPAEYRARLVVDHPLSQLRKP